ISYRTRLFKDETIACWKRYYERLITEFLVDSTQCLLKFDILSETEKQEILEKFNDTAVEFPREKIIPQLFEEQVEISRDRIAIVGQTVETLRATSLQNQYQYQYQYQITYHQLNEQSGRLAGLLAEKGAAPDTIVGIMLERSLEMIIGVLAILKTGSAYLPIDPEYPQEHEYQNSKQIPMTKK
ncbi:MAG: AMP-binding protein, partial [Acidobacteria bacterium]|nr:AMP-binding protein [Acidobacteriota bacterium]